MVTAVLTEVMSRELLIKKDLSQAKITKDNSIRLNPGQDFKMKKPS
jgi:hypothetical protein